MSFLKINDQEVGINEEHKLDEFLDDNSIYKIEIVFQDGPREEAGVNGLQVMDLIFLASRIVAKFNEILPCDENQKTFDHLQEAIEWQIKRDTDRSKRGVEGTNAA